MPRTVDIGSIGAKVLGMDGAIRSFNGDGKAKFNVAFPFKDTTYRTGTLFTVTANTDNPVVGYLIITKNEAENPGCQAYVLWIRCLNKTSMSIESCPSSYDSETSMCNITVNVGASMWGHVTLYLPYRNMSGRPVD